MIRIIFISVIFSFSIYCQYLFSQSPQVVSEYDRLKNKADTLWEERKFYESADYYLKAVELEKRSSNPDYKRISDSYGNAGFCYDDLGKYEKAIEYYYIALEYAKQANDSLQIATLYSNIAQSSVQIGKYDDAIMNLKASLEYDKALNNEEGVATNLSAVGKVYELWGKYEDAINYFSQALYIDRKNGQEAKVAIRLSSLASVYKTLGNYNKALEYQNEALEIDLKLNNRFKIAVRIDQIGEIYQYKKEYDKANKYFLEALQLLNEVEKNNVKDNQNRTYASHAIILNHLGKNYALTGNYEKAKEYYLKCLIISKDIQHNSMLIKTYKELSAVFEQTGNFKQAYKYYLLYSSQKDSTFNAESQKIISDFREKYETEKKEKVIALLTKDKEVSELNLEKITQQRTYIAILVILFAILSVLAYNRYRFKKKANIELGEKNRELEALNAVKNRFFSIISHDLKSPITSFQKITGSLNKSLEEIDKETLKEFIKDMNDTAIGLNDFLQKLLKWAMSQSGRLNPEKTLFSVNDSCETVIELLKPFAADNSITIVKTFSEDIKINSDKEMIETAVRNLLTNAIKFSNAANPVIIDIKRIDGKAKISITNSGPGLKQDEADLLFKIDTNHAKIGNHPAKGSGLGLILTNELIKLNEGKVALESSLPEKTTFCITLPIYNN